MTACRATVAFRLPRLGPGIGLGLSWNARAAMPTLVTEEPVRQLAVRLGIGMEAWLFDESGAVPVKRLGRFQGRQRRIIFFTHARAVGALLRFRLPAHPPCQGAAGGCSVCCGFLHRWRGCLAGAPTTVVRGRCAETAGLQA